MKKTNLMNGQVLDLINFYHEETQKGNKVEFFSTMKPVEIIDYGKEKLIISTKKDPRLMDVIKEKNRKIYLYANLQAFSYNDSGENVDFRMCDFLFDYKLKIPDTDIYGLNINEIEVQNTLNALGCDTIPTFIKFTGVRYRYPRSKYEALVFDLVLDTLLKTTDKEEIKEAFYEAKANIEKMTRERR